LYTFYIAVSTARKSHLLIVEIYFALPYPASSPADPVLQSQ